MSWFDGTGEDEEERKRASAHFETEKAGWDGKGVV